MSNPSLVWASLAVPNPASGGVTFVDTDNATAIIDVVNFKYTKLGASTIGTGSAMPYQLTAAGGLLVGYGDTTNTPSITVTLHKPAGRVTMPSGSANLLITNKYAFITSIILLQIEDANSTMTRIYPATLQGAFEVVGNAAASGNMDFSFVIINVEATIPSPAP